MSIFRYIIVGLLLLGLNIPLVSANDIFAGYRPVISWEKMSNADAITLFGPAVVPQDQMVKYILSQSPNPKINCSLEELVGYYYTEADIEGIRPDVALCQALKETDFFRYGNDVSYTQNNFCGLGATGNKEPGYSFFTPQRGVRAHIQHLIAYGSKKLPKQPLVDPRYSILVEKYPQYHGTANYWPDLNGRWAVPGTTYGQDILRLWREAQKNDYENSQLKNELREAEANPTDISAWQRVHITAYQAGNYREAINACNKILELDNTNLMALIHLGDIYREWGKNEEALASYDEALKLRPKKLIALSGRAYLLAIMGEVQPALEAYQKILDIMADDTVALYNHGCLLIAAGDAEKGRAELLKAEKLAPDNEIIKGAVNMYCNR